MRVYLAMNYCPLNNKFLHYITNIFWLWRWPETELIFGNSIWEALLFVIWPKSHYLFKMQGRMVKKKLYFYPAGRLSSSQNSGRSCPCSIFCQCDFTKTRASVNQEWLEWSFTKVKELEKHAAFREKWKSSQKIPNQNTNKQTAPLSLNQSKTFT